MEKKMKLSQAHFKTLREVPNEAEIPSHILLLRAGMIKKEAAGIYTYMPMGYRTIRKIENIVREEMDAKGGQEIRTSALQPSELWEESGRWSAYGPEMWRINDRNGRPFCLGPTAEEVVTWVAREGIRSYRQLPVNLYQIQNKYRDEIRPRFGLLRGREFIMKDAYSFDANQEGLEKSYKIMAETYTRIFNRCGLETRMVRSDSGAIGGSLSHEFMVLVETDSGENDVLYCEHCDYASNTNHAETQPIQANTDGGFSKYELVSTPNVKTIEEFKAVIPGKTLTEVNKIITDSFELIKIGVSKNQALFQMENCKIVTRLLDGEFLNYASVIPSNWETRVLVNKSTLQNCFERVSLISSSTIEKEKKYPVKINIEIGKIVISCANQTGDAKEELFLETEGKELEAGFNPKYFLDALKVIDDEEIFVDFGTSVSPAVIRPIENEDYTYMILPIRMKED